MFESGSSTEENGLCKTDSLALLLGWFQIKSHLPLQRDGDTDSSVTAAVIFLISRNYTNSWNKIKPMEMWVESAGCLTFYVWNDAWVWHEKAVFYIHLLKDGSFLCAHLKSELCSWTYEQDFGTSQLFLRSGVFPQCSLNQVWHCNVETSSAHTENGFFQRSGRYLVSEYFYKKYTRPSIEFGFF